MSLQRIVDIQHDIEATLGGTSKTWLNVQPCVIQGFNSLAQLALKQEERLRKAEDALDEIRRAMQLLINDGRLKEERYQLDHATQSEAVSTLEKLTQRLHLALDTEKQSRRHLRHEVQQLRREHGSTEKQLRQTSDKPETVTGEQITSIAKQQQQQHYSQKLHEDLIQEINLLRVQWENFSLNMQGVSPGHPDKQVGSPRDPYSHRCMSPGQYRRRPFLLQSARWFWLGDSGSHFSTALTRGNGSPGRAVSPPIPWEEIRLYDPVTACWYASGSCSHPDPGAAIHASSSQKCLANGARRPFYAGARPCAALHMNSHAPSHGAPGIEEARIAEETHTEPENMEQWNCFDWVRPGSIRILRPGIYKYTTCLLLDAHSTSLFSGGVGTAGEGLDNEVPILYVNHHSVANLGAGNSYVLLRTNTAANTPPRRRRSRSLGARWRSSPERFTRSCCESGQLITRTLSDYVFLPEDAVVQVRCHNMHNTKVISEAFLELEYIV